MNKESIPINKNVPTKNELLYVFEALYDLGKITELEYQKAIAIVNEYE